MPTDPATLTGFGVGAIVIVWLVFSVLKKVIGLAVLALLVGAGFVLWTNPGLLQAVGLALPG